MQCPGCGAESFDLLETCNKCGAPLVAGTVAPEASPVDPDAGSPGLRLEPDRSLPGQRLPGRVRHRTTPGERLDRGADFVEMLDDDAIEIGADDLEGIAAAGPESVESDVNPSFRIEDDLLFEPAPDARGVPGPAFVLSAELPGAEAGGEPIIDRYDEVPERYWAPEVAGLGRRGLALIVDQSIVMVVLGIFMLGAFIALRVNGIDTDLFLGPAGLQASALPFALLAVVLNLVYFSFFHWSTGHTPGKALFGLEVQTGAGGALTRGRALLRWLGAALGLACGGVGIVWAMFEPRRRGWADLVSGTLVARRQRESGRALPPLTSHAGRGYHASAVVGRDSSAGRATD